LISDTEGNIFGGFTPLEWKTRKWKGKYNNKNNIIESDDSLRSFLFRLRKPHGVPPWKFALRAEKKQSAIACDSACGPAFGDCEMCFRNNCNASSYPSLAQIGTRWRDCAADANDIAVGYFSTGTGGSH
jgi:hypothetical protein